MYEPGDIGVSYTDVHTDVLKYARAHMRVGRSSSLASCPSRAPSKPLPKMSGELLQPRGALPTRTLLLVVVVRQVGQLFSQFSSGLPQLA